MNEFTLADLILTCLVNVLFWYLGYRRGLHTAAMRITRQLIDNPTEIDRMVATARRNVTELEKAQTNEQVKVERHGDQLYIYTEDTNEFLAQGTTLEECLATIERRFPDRSFQGLLNRDQVDQLGITINK
jgi:hypothetical protein